MLSDGRASVLLSVVIPVYQVSDYVERCMRSVINQTFSDMECIIVDDATKDDSIVKCERLIQDYKGPIHFRIVHHERNRGLSAARNTGTKVATGDYIYYLDGDDEITTDCFEKLIKVAIDNPESEMIIGKAMEIRNNGKKRVMFNTKPVSQIRSNEKVVSYYHQQIIPVYAWNKLTKRAFIENNNLYFKEGIIIEDLLWMFYVVKYLSAVSFVNEVTYHYSIRPGSIMTSSDAQTIGTSYWIIFDEMLHHLTTGREDKELTRYVERYSKAYLCYKAIVPKYKELHSLYRGLARQYSCWYVRMVLVSVGMIGRFGIPLGFLGILNSMRWKVKRLFNEHILI